MFAQVDEEGNRHGLFQEIVDHRYDDTKVKDQDVFITMRTEKKGCRETRKGFEILVQWKDGSTTWVTLKDTENSYPVQMAKYAVQRRIAGDPEFAYWIWHMLAKRNHIIGNLKSKYSVRTQKFGINIPKSEKEANAFDEENGNTL